MKKHIHLWFGLGQIGILFVLLFPFDNGYLDNSKSEVVLKWQARETIFNRTKSV